MRYRQSSIHCLIFFICWIPVLVSAEAVFVSPLGDDTSDGRSQSRPVRSVLKAMQLASVRAVDGEVSVYFLPGSYGSQTIEVGGASDAPLHISLVGNAIGTERAEFDGSRGNSTWLIFRGHRRSKTSLTIRGFFVRNFRVAIQFLGDRFDSEFWSANNVIEQNEFHYIGQQLPGVAPSFAAISLINTRDTVISENRFVHVFNIEKCGGMHAIYLAGGSSNNSITGNVFDGGCGDTIKVRDRSNLNRIERNTFRRQFGAALLVDSFCDRRRQSECEDSRQECPSWGNIFRDNAVDRGAPLTPRLLHRQVGASNVPGCPAPVSGAMGRRIIFDD